MDTENVVDKKAGEEIIAAAAHSHYYVCQYCSHEQPVTPGYRGVIVCDRCGHRNSRLKPKSAELTMAFSLTALIFYIPANIFPFMSLELYGNRSSSTIWGGVVSLVKEGSWPIGVIVLLASIVIPLIKLVVLFYLSLTAKSLKHQRFKTRLYHFIETIGRWSMLDIFLLAVLVAILKLGPWTTVVPEVGSLLFALVVIFTMIASANFDPQLFWKEAHEEPQA